MKRFINTSVLKKSLYLLYYKTPVYDFFLNNSLSKEVSNILNDPWEGDSQIGHNILKGYITFFGETINYKSSMWEKNVSTAIWKEELHSFNWIKDIKAVGTNEARSFLRKSVYEWVLKYNKWSLSEWRSDIIGKRLYSLLGNFNFFCSSADNSFQKLMLESLFKQGNHLIKNKLQDISGYHRIFAIKGLIAISITYTKLSSYLDFSIELLLSEINIQVFDDGSHYLKSPSKHSEFLQNLIDIRSYLVEANYKTPKKINDCILKMASVLKFYKNGGETLTTFNNSKHTNKKLLNQIILRANSKIKIPESLTCSGFQKIAHNKINLLMDCGPPVGEDTYAGSLSFELSIGKNQMIVNCGSHYINNKIWTEAMKSTAAHSTLSIDNINSSDIFFNKSKKKSRIANVWSQRRKQGNCHWIDAAHSGYRDIFGLTHSRKIHIDSEKKIIRGQDYLSKFNKDYQRIAKKYYLRFHLFPDIEVNVTGSKKKAILKLPDGTGWEFMCSEPKIEIKESIYLGQEQKIAKNSHILVSDIIIPEKKIRWLFKLIK